MFTKHKASKCCLLTVAYHSLSSEPPVILDWDSSSTVNSVEPQLPMNEHLSVDEEGLYIDLGPQYPPPHPNPQSQGGSKEWKCESSGADCGRTA